MEKQEVLAISYKEFVKDYLNGEALVDQFLDILAITQQVTNPNSLMGYLEVIPYILDAYVPSTKELNEFCRNTAAYLATQLSRVDQSVLTKKLNVCNDSHGIYISYYKE